MMARQPYKNKREKERKHGAKDVTEDLVACVEVTS